MAEYSTGGPIRFVVLLHDWPAPHWDLLVDLPEGSPRVATWALAKFSPGLAATGRAEKLADHRREYLDFEGPVSGGRGCVRKVLAGQVMFKTTIGKMEFEMRGMNDKGEMVTGRLRLWQDDRLDQKSTLEHRAGANAAWRFEWQPDESFHVEHRPD